jgi:hypothetical protein
MAAIRLSPGGWPGLSAVSTGDSGRNYQDDEKRRVRCAGERSVHAGVAGGSTAGRGGVAAIIAGANAGSFVRDKHRVWYRELFQPCVAAGLIAAGALAGYRNDAVYLRTSRYVPPRWEAVRDAMPALFNLLENEPNALVRAVLGHWMCGYIHPYPDGNGLPHRAP